MEFNEAMVDNLLNRGVSSRLIIMSLVDIINKLQSDLLKSGEPNSVSGFNRANHKPESEELLIQNFLKDLSKAVCPALLNSDYCRCLDCKREYTKAFDCWKEYIEEKYYKKTKPIPVIET